MPDAPPIAQLITAAIDQGQLTRIRPWRAEDAPVLVAAWADPEVARWNGVPPRADRDAAQQWIEGTAQQTSESAAIDLVAVDVNDEVQGEIGWVIDRTRRVAEVGFWVGADHRRQGVGRRLLDTAAYLTSTFGIDRAFAVTDAANVAAGSLLCAAGWDEVETTTDERRAFVVPGST